MAAAALPNPEPRRLTLYTEAEIERLTDGKIGKRRLQQLRQRGGGPPFLKEGRRVLYPEAKFLEWLDAQLVCSTSDEPAA